jgi:hypothetical protein
MTQRRRDRVTHLRLTRAGFRQAIELAGDIDWSQLAASLAISYSVPAGPINRRLSRPPSANPLESLRRTAAYLLALALIAGLLPSVAAVAIAQEQVGSQAPKKTDRWDRQPRLKAWYADAQKNATPQVGGWLKAGRQ